MRTRPGRLSGLLLATVLWVTACSAATPSPTAPFASATASGLDGAPSASESASVAPSPSESFEPTLYTVVTGDTLFSIGQRFGTSVGQLQAWNAARYPGLADDPASLQAGWVLIVAGEPGVTPLPTSSATSRPSSTGLACRTGVRAASAPTATYRNIPNARPAVALTLDMGGRLDPALQIMNLLIANKVCVTLFPTGAMSQTAMGQQVLALVRAHPDLFEVGNHTMHHCDLVSGGGGSPTAAPCAAPWSPTADNIRLELTSAATIIKSATGQNPVPYWRPPYGSVNAGVISAAASVGYTKTMLWDVDTIDWKPISDGGPTAQQIASKVVANARNGSVVLMHLGGYETLDALRIMIPQLRQRGFTLTSISDLLDGR